MDGLARDSKNIKANDFEPFSSAEDIEKTKLLHELRELRIENEILKERMIQIKQLVSI